MIRGEEIISVLLLKHFFLLFFFLLKFKFVSFLSILHSNCPVNFPANFLMVTSTQTNGASAASSCATTLTCKQPEAIRITCPRLLSFCRKSMAIMN